MRNFKPVVTVKRGINTFAKFPVVAFDHLQGKKHTVHHRMFIGVCFMVVGVACSILLGGVFHHITSIRFVCDGVGYLLHGAGCTPFIEHFTTLVNVMEGDEKVDWWGLNSRN